MDSNTASVWMSGINLGGLVVGAVLFWLKLRDARQQAELANAAAVKVAEDSTRDRKVMAKKVEEVHDIVNSQRTAMEAKIAELTAELSALKPRPNTGAQ